MFNQYEWLSKDALIIHTDLSGNLVWSATMDSLNSDRLAGIYNLNGAVYAGFENGFGKTSLDTSTFNVKKYTPDGNPAIDIKSMGKCSNADVICTFAGYDGINLLLGTLRTDSSGNLIWAHRYNVLHLPADMFELSGGGFLCQGTGYWEVTHTTDVVLFDSAGSSSCVAGPVQITVDSFPERLIYSPVQAAVCSVAVYVPPIHWHNVGSVMDYCEVLSTERRPNQSFDVYPNPFSESLHIHITGLHEKTILRLFSVVGIQLMEISFFTSDFEFDVSHLPSGVYFLCIQNSKGMEIEKVVKSP
jgi:hypothetical protein